MWRIGLAAMVALVGCGGGDGGGSDGGGRADGGGGGQVDAGPGPDAAPGAPDAQAELGNRVLVFGGDGAIPPEGAGCDLICDIDDLTEILGGVGAEVVVSETWPADIGAYRLILWYQPGASEATGFTIPAARVAQLEAFLDAGGRIVVGGDLGYAGLTGADGVSYSGVTANQAIDRLMETMGLAMRLDEAYPGAVACPGASDHPLVAGTTLAFKGANGLIVGPAATWLSCGGLAIQRVGNGELLLIGDVQPISDAAAANATFVARLFTVSIGP